MLAEFSFFPEQASTVAARVDALFWYLLVVTVFFAVLIAALLAYFMIRYRRREGDDRTRAVRGSPALEVAWTAIPLALAMVAFLWGASIFVSLRQPPEDAMEIQVVGKQWMWKMQHLGGRREINMLHVPVGRPVKLTLTSEDVIHSFYVPAFRIKQDVLPGRYTTAWFEATKPGTYRLFCAEYCGTLHSAMVGDIVVMEQSTFQEWLNGAGGKPAVSVRARGEDLFKTQRCSSCHREERTGLGPPLAGLFGSQVRLQTGETVAADDAYLRESILDPRAKTVAGYQPVMPTYQGLVSEEEVLQLIAYIKSLPAGGSEEP